MVITYIHSVITVQSCINCAMHIKENIVCSVQITLSCKILPRSAKNLHKQSAKILARICPSLTESCKILTADLLRTCTNLTFLLIRS